MHFPLLACLVTILGLVSAGPIIKTVTYCKLVFLSQKSPVQSVEVLERRYERIGLPQKFNEFFNLQSVREALEFSASTTPSWDVLAQDHTYKDAIGVAMPVYAAFKGGKKCGDLRCLAIVVDGSHGMITTSARLVAQAGNPAIVSFTNWQTTVVSPESVASTGSLAKIDFDYLAHKKVHWLLNAKKVKEELGFVGEPKIVYVDKLPLNNEETQHQLSFHLYGGTMCCPKRPCTALIEFISEALGFRGRIFGLHERLLVEVSGVVD